MSEIENRGRELIHAAWEQFTHANYSDSLALLGEAERLAPSDPEVYQARGQVQEHLGDWAAAEASYLQAAKAATDSARPYIALARLYKRRGDAVAERRALERAAGMPNGVDRQMALGDLAMQDQRYSDALTHYLNAKEWHTDDPWLDLALGNVLLLLGRNEKALEYLIQAVRTAQTEVRAVAHYNAGVAAQRLRRYDRAVTEFRAAIETDPNYYKAYQALSALEARMGRLVSAWRHFRAAVKLVP